MGATRGRRRSRKAAQMVSLGLLTASLAVSGAEIEPAPAAAAPGRYYGWQIALADIAATGTLAGWLAIARDPSRSGSVAAPVLIAGVLIYLIDGSVIHSLHGQSGPAARSLLLRLFVPIAFGFIGGLAGGSGLGVAIGGAYGIAIGMVGAAATDWISAWERQATSDLPGAARSSLPARALALTLRF